MGDLNNFFIFVKSRLWNWFYSF